VPFISIWLTGDVFSEPNGGLSTNLFLNSVEVKVLKSEAQPLTAINLEVP